MGAQELGQRLPRGGLPTAQQSTHLQPWLFAAVGFTLDVPPKGVHAVGNDRESFARGLLSRRTARRLPSKEFGSIQFPPKHIYYYHIESIFKSRMGGFRMAEDCGENRFPVADETFLEVDDLYHQIAWRLKESEAMLQALSWGVERLQTEGEFSLGTMVTLIEAVQGRIEEARIAIDEWYAAHEDAYQAAKHQEAFPLGVDP
jgi:hypothetical protein